MKQNCCISTDFKLAISSNNVNPAITTTTTTTTTITTSTNTHNKSSCCGRVFLQGEGPLFFTFICAGSSRFRADRKGLCELARSLAGGARGDAGTMVAAERISVHDAGCMSGGRVLHQGRQYPKEVFPGLYR